MKKYKLSLISLLANIGCVVGIIIYNHNLAVAYISADGKTKALFGIIELSRLDHKIELGALGILSLVFVILAIRQKEIKWLIITAVIFSIVSISSVFVNLWTYMI